MADTQRASMRGNHRGNPRGHSHRGARGGGSSNPRGGAHSADGTAPERPKKENILDLSKYRDKEVTVKFAGGREVRGVLKGFDMLMNLVLDDVREVVRDDEGQSSTRELGLLVARGTVMTSLAPVDGSEDIANPFLVGEEGEGGEDGDAPVLG